MNKKNLFFWILIAGIFIGGAWYQSSLILSLDVSWLMEVASRLMRGGKYYLDFYETNPPMSIYIYLPALLFHYLHLGVVVGVRAYTFIIAATSICLCHYLLSKDSKIDFLLHYLLLVGLAILLVFFPSGDFGQREHIAVMLIMPYLLQCVLRVKGLSFSKQLVIPIAILAGIGFVIKPHFLLPLFLIEMKILLNKKTVKNLISEIIIGLIIIAYVLSIFYLTPEFIKLMLVDYLPIYYLLMGEPFASILFSNVTLYGFIVVCLYLVMRDKVLQKDFADFLLLAALGFWLVFIIEDTGWYNHYLPSLLFFCLLAIVMLYSFFVNTLPTDSIAPLLKYGVVFCFSLAMFYMPVTLFLSHNTILSRATRNLCWEELVRFIGNQSPAKIYVLYGDHYPAYPLVDYTNTTLPSRFPSLWRLMGEVVKQRPNFNERGVRAIFVNDLVKTQPDLVLVYKSRFLPMAGTKKFDYLEYFLQDVKFRSFWHNYHFLKKIGYFEIYQIAQAPIRNRHPYGLNRFGTATLRKVTY